MKRESLARFQALLPPVLTARGDSDAQLAQVLFLVARMKEIASASPSPLCSPCARRRYRDHVRAGISSLFSCWREEMVFSEFGEVLEDALDDLLCLLEATAPETPPWIARNLSMSQSPRRAGEAP